MVGSALGLVGIPNLAARKGAGGNAPWCQPALNYTMEVSPPYLNAMAENFSRTSLVSLRSCFLNDRVILGSQRSLLQRYQ